MKIEYLYKYNMYPGHLELSMTFQDYFCWEKEVATCVLEGV